MNRNSQNVFWWGARLQYGACALGYNGKHGPGGAHGVGRDVCLHGVAWDCLKLSGPDGPGRLHDPGRRRPGCLNLPPARPGVRLIALTVADCSMVALAQRHITGWVVPALGIGNRCSTLYRRISMLVQTREPLAHCCGWPRNLGTTATGAVLIVFASSLRLDASVRKPDATDSTVVVAQPPAAAPSIPGTVFVCRVRDKETGKPVALAKVNVRLSVTDRATDNRKTLTEIRQRTSAEGIYRFTITPEQLAEPTLFVRLDIEHPGYVRRRRGLNVKAVNRENQPFVDDALLERGKAIEARLLTPEGTPAANVKIGAYTTHHPAQGKTTSSGRSRKP